MPNSSIAAPINKAAHIRNLRDSGLTIDDIRELTDYRLPEIKAALARPAKGKLKSRVLAGGAQRGPLTAGEVAEKLGIPETRARLVTGE